MTLLFLSTTASRIRARTTECASTIRPRRPLYASAQKDTKVTGVSKKLTTARHRLGAVATAYASISLAQLMVSSVIVNLDTRVHSASKRSISVQQISAVTTAPASIDLRATSASVTLDMKENSVRRRKTIALPTRV